MSERGMRFAQVRVEREGALRRRASLRENVAGALEAENAERGIRGRESSVCAGKPRIPLRSLDVVLHRTVDLRALPCAEEVLALQIQLIRLEVFGRPLGEAGRYVAPRQANRQRGRDVTGDLFLNGEDVAAITIVGCRPHHAVASRVDELGHYLE